LIKINSRRSRVAIHHSRPAPLDVPNTPRCFTERRLI
jgi:hypothetical protein